MPGGVRFIGLSTCLSNPLDVAEFLNVPRRGCYNFPPNLRAIPLRTFIRGFPGRHFCPRMKSMNKPLSDAILEHYGGKPALVFVPSRRQTRVTAYDLICYATARGEPFFYSTPETALASEKVKDPDLSHCLSFGIGLHHAGLNPNDCKIVEDLFANGKMKLLVATSTLAWGVNLPAHFVVIKGTEYKDPKTCQYVPYSVTEMQQMMGRAGRPQFDTEGVVMIFCEDHRKDFLKRFINSPLPVESFLPENIYDHANAEIACGRIKSRNSLIAWLKRSFFAIRLEKNPVYYGNVTLEQVADDVISVLTHNYLCTDTFDGTLSPTQEGKIASLFYVSYKTISLFVQRMNEAKDIMSLLRLICWAPEFNDVPVRRNEDQLVANMDVRFPCDDPPGSSHTKAYYMVQYYFSHKKMPLPDFDSDLSSVLDQLLRIVGCFLEVASIRRDLQAVINCSILDQMLVQGQWYDDSPFFSLLDADKYNKYIPKGLTLLPQLLLSPNIPKELEFIKEHVLLYKKQKILIATDRTAIKLVLEKVSGELGSRVLSNHFSRKEIQSINIFIGDPQNNKLLGHKRVQLKKNLMNVIISSTEPIPNDAWIYVLSDAYIGIDQIYPIAQTQMEKLQKSPIKVEMNPQILNTNEEFQLIENNLQKTNKNIQYTKNSSKNEVSKTNPQRNRRNQSFPPYRPQNKGIIKEDKQSNQESLFAPYHPPNEQTNSSINKNLNPNQDLIKEEKSSTTSDKNHSNKQGSFAPYRPHNEQIKTSNTEILQQSKDNIKEEKNSAISEKQSNKESSFAPYRPLNEQTESSEIPQQNKDIIKEEKTLAKISNKESLFAPYRPPIEQTESSYSQDFQQDQKIQTKLNPFSPYHPSEEAKINKDSNQNKFQPYRPETKSPIEKEPTKTNTDKINQFEPYHPEQQEIKPTKTSSRNVNPFQPYHPDSSNQNELNSQPKETNATDQMKENPFQPYHPDNSEQNGKRDNERNRNPSRTRNYSDGRQQRFRQRGSGRPKIEIR